MTALSRRRQPRIRFRAPLRLKNAHTAHAVDATCLDLSQGGMRVQAPAICAVGTSVLCELQVEDRQLSLPGVVAWTDPPAAPSNGANGQRDPETDAALYETSTDAGLLETEDYAHGERADTKTLVRLGGDAADPVVVTRPARRQTQGLYRLGSSAPPAPGEIVEPEPGPEPRDAAIGIRFETLSQAHAQLLGNLIRDGERLTSPVHVWFSGLADPIRARAETSATTLQVRAPLPFLALDSSVRIGVDPDSEEQQGRIRSVELVTAPGEIVPRLEIRIALASAGEDTAGAPDERPGNNARSSQPIPPSSASALGFLLAALIAGAGLGGAGTWFMVARPAREAAAKDGPGLRPPAQRFAGPHVMSQAPSAIEAEKVAPSTTQPAAASVGLRENATLAANTATAVQPASAREPAEPSAEQPATAAPDSVPVPEVARADTQLTKPAPAPALAPATGATPEVLPPLAAPEITIKGHETRIFVPMDGNDEDISRYELTSPGLVVSLPHAHPHIAFEDYPIYQGLVRRVWLRPHGEGAQVRVVWRQAPVHSKVIFDDRGLTIALRF
jgi:hypothetical protein